ncbi:MAG: flavodoxin family protein [Thermoanaerobacteraceae bacterium]|uniref:flavodoxin family protein n=1 Tax=Thermanaeromonas sp. C210 TaxID=2731925 RepID=UPI00155D2850|nr:flavodoxin family protein [Thermanaeromonas sp. C210]MBE3582293.1 flavodoxin family protein [Thermoanaerobacteraceae bacterium]GFN22821.1 FMN reductase [Thermanaeromonas sp. C210]
MKVLGIAASPRRLGNSELLLDLALEGAREGGADTHKIVLAGLGINPCRGCEACRRGKCVQRDDMDLLYPKLEAADAVILASPIYFYGLTAQAKAMVDRCQVFWNRSRQELIEVDRSPRRGVLIAVGATRGAKLFEGAVLTAKYFFKALDMSYWRDLLVRGADEWGAVRRRPEVLAEARNLGKDLVLTHYHS